MKMAIIMDRDDGQFGLEYDNTVGTKNTMSLEALSYERAIREAKSYLEIGTDDLDADGTLWHVG